MAYRLSNMCTRYKLQQRLMFRRMMKLCGGVVVRALDSRWAGCEFDSHGAAALSGNNLGQVVHINVPLFTKQYIWYLARAFMLTCLYVASIGRGPMNKSIVVAVLQRSVHLEPRYKLSTLLYFTL